MKDNLAGEEALEREEYQVDGFVIRSPLLPVGALSELMVATGSTDWTDESAYARACETIRAHLRSYYSLPEVAEALLIASPTLAKSLPAWLKVQDSDSQRRVERSLVKYLTRMSTRPTPFGLFSGCSAGKFGGTTLLNLARRSEYRRHSRIDMGYLLEVSEALNRDGKVRDRVTYRPNDSIVRLSGRLRYVERRAGPNKTRQYHWVGTDTTPYLDLVLGRSEPGALLSELKAALLDQDSEIDEQEAVRYLHELVDAQLLVPSLGPRVTGPEPSSALVQQLYEVGEDDEANRLHHIVQDLARIDAAGLGRPETAYLGLVERATGLRASAPLEAPQLVQVDMTKPGDLTLGPKVREEVIRCAQMVGRFGSTAEPLTPFCEAFEARYGTGAVPLLEALDPEVGIGLGDGLIQDDSPLLNGLPLIRNSAPERSVWRRQDQWLLDRLQQVWRSGSTELTVADHELEEILRGADQVPPTNALCVGMTLVADSATAIDKGDFSLVLRGVQGPSGVRFLGRFAHIDKAIEDLTRAHLAAEEDLDPGAILAEIVHLPPGRLGNVIIRPVLRKYELVYLGVSGAPSERQLPLSDLLVTVRGKRVFLWSKRLEKFVVPRLTSAHNFATPGSLLPYRFLALMQSQGTRCTFTWDWGPLRSAPFLPRVRWGRIILSRATWQMTAQDIKELGQRQKRDRFIAAREWADQRGVPRFFELVDGDNTLTADLANPLSIDAVVELIRGRERATIAEMLPNPTQLCVTGPEGGFTHDIYVPVIRRRDGQRDASDTPARAIIPRHESRQVRRRVAPGGEWLFIKVYTGSSEVDRILVSVVRPLLMEIRRASWANGWFFVRYQDPENHLRIRFQGEPRTLNGEVLPRLEARLDPALAAGAISRISVETYQRELERYGGPEGLALSEQVFEADSDAVLEILAALRASQLDATVCSDLRWQLSLEGMVEMMRDLGFEPEQMRTVIERRRGEFGEEFNVRATALRHALGARYRRYKTDVAAALQDSDRTDPLESPERTAIRRMTREIWRRRSVRLQPIVSALRTLEADGQLTVPLSVLVDSYLHMHVNRIAKADGRACELVLFEFLSRYYESRAARLRSDSSSKSGQSS